MRWVSSLKLLRLLRHRPLLRVLGPTPVLAFTRSRASFSFSSRSTFFFPYTVCPRVPVQLLRLGPPPFALACKDFLLFVFVNRGSFSHGRFGGRSPSPGREATISGGGIFFLCFAWPGILTRGFSAVWRHNGLGFSLLVPVYPFIRCCVRTPASEPPARSGPWGHGDAQEH